MTLTSALGTELPVISARAFTSPSVSNWSRLVLSSNIMEDEENILEKDDREMGKR